jgi:hypothetical protein
VTYIGDLVSDRTLGTLNRVVAVSAGLLALTITVIGVSGLLASNQIASMKEETAIKSKAVLASQEQAKIENSKPASERAPSGLGAVGAFQTKLNRLTAAHGCSLAQFQASDQMTPYISSFSSSAVASGNWMQVDVKLNLMGGTSSVIGALKDLNTIGIPYEFTSLEMNRVRASDMGEASVSANVSLRVLTIPGGS